MSATESDSPAKQSANVDCGPVPCSDCGKPSNGIRYMHVQVSGMFVRLCDDCLEEANLMETIYAQPCYHCGGSGREWEGWDCEHCDGTGTDDY